MLKLFAGSRGFYVLWNTKCAFLQSLQALKSEKVMEADVQDLRSKLNIAAEALRKAEERALAGQFALEVMHEIRNPLEAFLCVTRHQIVSSSLASFIREENNGIV